MLVDLYSTLKRVTWSPESGDGNSRRELTTYSQLTVERHYLRIRRDRVKTRMCQLIQICHVQF